MAAGWRQVQGMGQMRDSSREVAGSRWRPVDRTEELGREQELGRVRAGVPTASSRMSPASRDGAVLGCLVISGRGGEGLKTFLTKQGSAKNPV